MRRLLYQIARMMGDLNAVLKNRIGQRIVTRIKWRMIGRLLR